MARLESPARSQQIDDKLADESWQQVAEFAAYCCQCNTLHLKPWQSPPCWVDPRDIKTVIARGNDGAAGDYAAAKLLQKMLQNGLSKYEPDPIRALDAAKKLPPAV
jgi:hypothetical protein